MKAIKGLEDRLYALDQMIASCKKLVNEQKELAQVSKINILKDTLNKYVSVCSFRLALAHEYFQLTFLTSRDFWPIRSGLKT